MAQPLHEPLGLTVPENGCLAPGEEEAEHQGLWGHLWSQAQLCIQLLQLP